MTADAPTAPEDQGHPRRWAILIVLSLCVFLVAIDNTVLNVALPSISEQLHASNRALQWMVDAYSLVFAGLLMTAGSLSDRHGRKKLLIVGLVFFGGASAAAAFAQDTGTLIGMRGLMGIGGAFLMPSTLAILVQVFHERDRQRAIAIWGTASALGIALGPVIGGVLVSHFWWGSVFLVNVPIGIAAVVAVAVLVPETRDLGARRTDLPGALLSTLAMSSLVYGVVQLSEHGWYSPQVWGPLVGAAVAAALFVWRQARAESPMVELSMVLSPRFIGAALSGALLMFALVGSVFVLTQHLQLVLGYSPLRAGFATVPVALAVMVTAPLSPAITQRIGVRTTVAIGLVVLATGMVLFATLAPRAGYRPVLAGLLVLGCGIGLATAPVSDALMSSAPKEKAGLASASNDTVQELGSALGVALAGSALAAGYADGLPAGLPESARRSLAGALEFAGLQGPAGGALAEHARYAFGSGMRLSMLICAGVALIGAVCAFLMLPSCVPPQDESAETPAAVGPDPLGVA
ncbi:EmrB/QacA subfamily drug resistance transporter [Kitasatospora sp. SolWspMP-SS2h]|uniref:MFS transporter n=1 Tax=Kitasatospora sp. SolWspMP-SS2h TaxID=1305729 RepID=UPI000DBA057F|nr:MFS transporter [Kitasatospora sp. SolWspMP-SS2h]RAJ36142.1 EmrB/QacA subfamily drug resistance transporter [Kitasatospora sp. SolWspMP-SS2h]